MRHVSALVLVVLGLVLIATAVPASANSSSTRAPANAGPRNVMALAGTIASTHFAAGGLVRPPDFGDREERNNDPSSPVPTSGITPTFVLSSPLDGTSVAAPTVTINQDTHAASQNEPAIAVDPNNPNRIVAAANDYVTRTWSCDVGGTPCSGLGDGYSGTYFSNDGGATWCCVASDPRHQGTLIPGVTRLSGGQYDAGGDPAVAFDSRGRVYYAGLGFDRTAPPNTVAVNKGTFDKHGALRWGPPAVIGQTEDPTILDDKEWIAADSHEGSRFRDRVYVTWTLYSFDAVTGDYIQSPIAFSFSKNGGATFSTPRLIVGDVLYDQGSRVMVGSDGAVFVVWEGSRATDAFNSIWMVTSRDGGSHWSDPVAIAPLVDILPPANTVFRTNSFPAADIAPDGTLYVAWSAEVLNSATTYGADPTCAYFYSGVASVYANCHSSAVWSSSADGGGTWSTPVPILTVLDASNRMADGYPVTQPNGNILNAPAARRVDSFWPAVAASPSGKVYLSAYAGDVVSPWRTCAAPATPVAVGRINCLALGPYINNTRLDYVVTNAITGTTKTVTPNPVNTRYHFGGGFIGDYTDLAVGSDDVFHAVWTDTNQQQSVTWWFGFEFVPTTVNQQDMVTAAGTL